MKKRWWIIAAAIVIILGGCEDKKSVTTKYNNIVAVYMHNPGVYSFMTQEGTAVNLVFPSGQRSTDINADVPPDQPMYADVEYWESGSGGNNYCIMHLHIHSVKDLAGGSYDAGTRKYPDEVQTVPLEVK